MINLMILIARYVTKTYRINTVGNAFNEVGELIDF